MKINIKKVSKLLGSTLMLFVFIIAFAFEIITISEPRIITVINNISFIAGTVCLFTMSMILIWLGNSK